MRTTLDLSDELLERAKQHARKTGRPLRAIVEEGLRLVLRESARTSSYVLPDRSVGNPRDPNPLASLRWSDLRDRIYGRR